MIDDNIMITKSVIIPAVRGLYRPTGLLLSAICQSLNDFAQTGFMGAIQWHCLYGNTLIIGSINIHIKNRLSPHLIYAEVYRNWLAILTAQMHYSIIACKPAHYITPWNIPGLIMFKIMYRHAMECYCTPTIFAEATAINGATLVWVSIHLQSLHLHTLYTGLNLGLRQANKRRRYFVTTFLIGRA